jgi:hypothetical protein
MVPYAIDFGNPAPDAELTSVGAENFEWVVEESAKWLCCKKTKAWKMNLTWGTFMKDAVTAK